MEKPTYCVICEVRADTSVIGLCARCEAFPVLVEAYTEGLTRKAVQAPEPLPVVS